MKICSNYFPQVNNAQPLRISKDNIYPHTSALVSNLNSTPVYLNNINFKGWFGIGDSRTGMQRKISKADMEYVSEPETFFDKQNINFTVDKDGKFILNGDVSFSELKDFYNDFSDKEQTKIINNLMKNVKEVNGDLDLKEFKGIELPSLVKVNRYLYICGTTDFSAPKLEYVRNLWAIKSKNSSLPELTRVNEISAISAKYFYAPKLANVEYGADFRYATYDLSNLKISRAKFMINEESSHTEGSIKPVITQ